MDICPRAPWARYYARDDFNSCVQDYNIYLRQLCLHSHLPVSCAPLRGLRDSNFEYLSADGVHPSSTPHNNNIHSGVFKYIMSVRQAIVNSINY